MTYLSAITIVHTALSLLALLVGVAALFELFHRGAFRWLRTFFSLAAATSVTGFLFRFHGPTPAVITGVLALLILVAVYVADSRRGFAGHWRWIYAAGIVASEYLLVFVAIVQAFLKIPGLTALAPTQTELPFVAAQLSALVAFVVLGIVAAVRFRPEPAPAMAIF